jgi:RND family efflux transporter MFP subunit
MTPLSFEFTSRDAAPRPMLAALALLVAGAAILPACSTAKSTAAEPPRAAEVVSVETTTPVVEPIVRQLRVTGSLVADEQAEVSAEIAGRVVGTPVERGTRVPAGALLVQLSTDQAQAQLAEADANAARIAAGLGLDGDRFEVERVPDVANARAEWELAQAEYDRIRSLLEQRVVSQSEYDQRRTRVEAARQRYESERNRAQQEFRAWEAARARVTLARKGLGDTAVRAPFSGIVAERLVSAGDFVSVGTRVATVVRVDPLRVVLTVPEQFVSQVRAGQPVTFTVDAYPGQSFEGTVRYISPAVRAEMRALTVEAVVPNPTGALKPGLFATAQLAQPAEDALLVDRRAIREVGQTVRLFVVHGDVLEERIVTTGQVDGGRVEIVAGLERDDVVALPGKATLTEGLKVRAIPGGGGAAARAETPAPPPAR